MLSWIFQMTVLSIIFILLIHHLILFLKENLTVPKIKDLVNAPSQKYKDMYKIISQDKENQDKIQENNSIIINKNNSSSINEEYSYTKEDLLPKPDVENMKNELKSFLKEQLQSSTLKNGNVNNNFISSTDIVSLDKYDSYYSNY